jgi:hypothetical protein
MRRRGHLEPPRGVVQRRDVACQATGESTTPHRRSQDARQIATWLVVRRPALL